MTPDELVAIRKGIKFSQQNFSDRMGVGIRTYQKWELGESPIRPMVARSILNVVELVKIENKARQAKVVVEKAEALRESLMIAVEGLKTMGAHGKSSDRILELLAQNRVPSKEEVSSLFRTLESPVQLAANTFAVIQTLVLEAKKSRSEEEATEYFRLILKESMDHDTHEQLIDWAEKNYLMTSTDVVKSVFKAVSKKLSQQS
jgi:transcriptional regulator with XRE-family HTH domain